MLALLSCIVANAQSADKPLPDAPTPVRANPIGVSTSVPFYTVDKDFRIKIRDLEFDANQLEIEIQTLGKKIEEDKAKEAEIWRKVSQAAAAYAEDKKIDPTKYDFDVKEIKFPQKKKQ